MTDLTNPIFHDETKAREHLEALRWPDGPVCPYCSAERPKKLGGKSMGPGWYHCPDCRKKFTVRVGTVYERSKVPLHKWLLATQLMASSKKGVSAHQIHRTIGVTYKTAWFMAHRIREAMRPDDLTPMGGGGGPVEADETFIGREPGRKKGKKAFHHKMKVLTLIDRESGQARSMVVDDLKSSTLGMILRENLAKEARLMTDEARYYIPAGKQFASHETVNHGVDEYARGDITTNAAEGYFNVFKRGMKGVYQHCAKRHLHRYLAEFDFRYSTREALGIGDNERRDRLLKGIEGKRLTYRRSAALHIA